MQISFFSEIPALSGFDDFLFGFEFCRSVFLLELVEIRFADRFVGVIKPEKLGEGVVDTGESTPPVFEENVVGKRFHQLPEKKSRFNLPFLLTLLPEGVGGFESLA